MLTQRVELYPGIWLNYVGTDRFKTGCFSFNLLRPLKYDDAAPNALVPSVLLRGCKNSPDMQSISKRLDLLYGAGVGTLIRKKGEVQAVGVYSDFLEDRYAEGAPVFQQVMEFIRDLLFAPCLENGGFLPSYLDGERLNLSNTLDSRINDKRSYAMSRLLHYMCNGEDYRVPRLGEKDTLQPLTGASLYQLWQAMLMTSQIELFYLGQQPKEQVVDLLRRTLEPLAHRDTFVQVQTKVLFPDRPVQYKTEALDVTQGKLTMGLRTDITVHDPRYPALIMLNAVFGAGMTSKLFVKIREEQSLCYYASSSVDKFKGIMAVSSGIEFDQYDVARDGILHQLNLCKQGEITEDEMESARNYLISSLRTGNDSPGRLDDFSIGQALAGLSYSMDDMAEYIGTVTKDQVVQAANSLNLDTVYFLEGVGV